MPAEITNTDEFVGLSETAHECRVKRYKDLVKLKLRNPTQLYTLMVKVDRADDVIRRLKCEIVEVWPPCATGIIVTTVFESSFVRKPWNMLQSCSSRSMITLGRGLFVAESMIRSLN